MSRPPITMQGGRKPGRARAAEPGAKRSGRPLGKRGTEILASVPLFSGLSKRHLHTLARLADEVAFRKGASVVQEGQLGETLFVILEGEAKVVRGGRRIATMLPGDFFGEISLLDGGPRTASVVAVTPLVAVRIHRRPFLKTLAAEPDMTTKVLVELTGRLRRAQRPVTG